MMTFDKVTGVSSPYKGGLSLFIESLDTFGSNNFTDWYLSPNKEDE